MASFGKWKARSRIRAAIERSGKSQKWWAARLGLSESGLGQQLRGSPGVALAQAFGMRRIRTATGASRYVLQSPTVQ